MKGVHSILPPGSFGGAEEHLYRDEMAMVTEMGGGGLGEG